MIGTLLSTLHGMIKPLLRKQSGNKILLIPFHFRKERVVLAKNEVLPELIVGFVTCLQEENRWLACVLDEVCSDTRK